MAYTNKNIKDIPKWLGCPLCGDYETNKRRYFINHFNKCEEYDGHIDDIETYDIDDELSMNDYINQELNCINTTKRLIQTNELQNIQNQTPNEIRSYIKNKLLENEHIYSSIDLDAIKIYDFFFGETEESKNEYIKDFMAWSGFDKK